MHWRETGITADAVAMHPSRGVSDEQARDADTGNPCRFDVYSVIGARKFSVVTLDLASTFPGSMPIVGDAAHKLADRVKRATGGELVIKFYEPNKLVSAAETVNAVAAYLSAL
jgi:TRAP-type mannitol/chloroaromatic compound transport system substrate-binding protein